MNATDGITTNREHKDRLFNFIFGAEENKKYLLSMYNAINDTHYTNIEDIEITTLMDVIYMRMKNDVSFLLHSEISLYEHQSTFNPNMPLRGLMYFASLYAQILSIRNKDIYGSSLVKIPTPRYIVFYNGNKSYPDKMELKLSDAFEKPDHSGMFEWTATMLNINIGHNKELFKKCLPLWQYADYVDKVKTYSQSMPIKEAIDKAVNYAINANYLDGFFKKHKESVMGFSLTEFDEELFIKNRLEEGCIEERTRIIKNLLDKNKSHEEIIDLLGVTEEDILSALDSINGI